VLLALEVVARAGIEPSLTGLKDRAPLQKRNARKWWAREGSNFLPSACLADALPMSYAPLRIRRTPETESNRRMLGIGQRLRR
jgi:hypothetical protein